MAKRKRKYNTKKSKREAQINLGIISTIVLSVLLAVLLYTNSGAVGNFLNDAFGGMVGSLRFVLPIGTFIIAIEMAYKNENEYITQKLVQYTILLICIAIIMSVHQISKGAIDINTDLSQTLKKAYTLGSGNVGGGAIGTLGAVPLVKMLGKAGAIVLSVGVSIILFVFVFGINVSEVISNFIENTLERKEERKIIREEKRRENQEQAEIRRAEIIERRKKRKEEIAQRKAAETQNNNNQIEDQIKINLNGRLMNDELSKEQRKSKTLDMTNSGENANLEQGTLFKQEEEKKEDKTKQVLQLEHTLTVEEDNYVYPPIKLLGKPEKKALKGGTKSLTETASRLQKTLHSFGVSAKVENVSVGPAITRYELKPAEGVRVSKIANLADDIALNLAAETIRIEAPIPGKQAVGIEVPNKEKQMVPLREVIESDEFQNEEGKLSIALGKDIAGNAVIANIAKMPHVLIAGSTGSGKSVCINTIITSIIYHAKPSEVKMIMVDPKVVELSVYNEIPHLLIPVVTDPKKAAGALAWAVQEMDNRYSLFAKKGVRDLDGFNKAIENDKDYGRLPQIVIIIDELADLMMVAAKEVEESICRLAQKARAAGMHLVIATQRPSVDVITGLIKANVPSRIAFAVSSQIDSRTILDQVGAEKLLGKGDMLFFPAGAPKPTRVQGAFVSDDEVESIVEFVKANGVATYDTNIINSIEKETNSDSKDMMQDNDDDTDPFLDEAINIVVETGQASTSFIQRRFKVGYSRAGRIIDQMEARGVISGFQGSKPREVLWTIEKLAELNDAKKNEEA